MDSDTQDGRVLSGVSAPLRRIAELFSRKKKPDAGYVHVHCPAVTYKSLTSARCIDCKQDTIFVGIFQEYYGWTETCIRCGRRFADGEWLHFDFYREARRDSIKSAIEQWGRAHDADRIHRVKVKASTASASNPAQPQPKDSTNG